MGSFKKHFSNKGTTTYSFGQHPGPKTCLLSKWTSLSICEATSALWSEGMERHCIKDKEDVHFGGWMALKLVLVFRTSWQIKLVRQNKHIKKVSILCRASSACFEKQLRFWNYQSTCVGLGPYSECSSCGLVFKIGCPFQEIIFKEIFLLVVMHYNNW